MSRIHFSECPVCSSRNLKKFIDIKDFSISKEDFELFECTDCGFILTQDMPDEVDIVKYYKSEEYISHSDTSRGLINKVYHIVRAVMLQKKAQMVETVSGIRKGKILDIGTGLGYFPEQMRNRGWNVEAIEQDSETRASTAKRLNINIGNSVDLLNMTGKEYDVITMWHVLEHVHKLNEYMEVIKKNLSDEGTLIIAIPNPASPDAVHYQKYWAAYDVPRHLWHWNPASFEKFASKFGFSITAKKPMPMDGFYVSMLSEKYKTGKASLMKGLFHGKISWLKSLNNNDLSSSVIYFLQKV